MQSSLLDVDSQQSTSWSKFKVGIALVGGSGLALLSVMALFASDPSATGATDLIGMPTSSSLRAANPVFSPMAMHNIPGPDSLWKKMAIAYIEDSNRCGRDVSVGANAVKSVTASLNSQEKAMVAKAQTAVKASAETLLKAGVTAPWGFWDPSGFATDDVSEGRLLFFREAEIKHGRVCMLAFVGMAVGENYHPLFGGNIDIPAAGHFSLTGGDTFWAFAYVQFLFAAFWEECRTSLPVIEGKAFHGLKAAARLPIDDNPEAFAVVGGRIPGDLGFDPLGLKPKNEKDLITMQNKELNNGRLAMIAVIGTIAQELVTNEKIFR